MRRTGKMVLACLLAASAMLTACGGSGDTGSAGSAGQQLRQQQLVENQEKMALSVWV